ncbi:MAG: hypothetical protein ACK56I_12265 [bacterium]
MHAIDSLRTSASGSLGKSPGGSPPPPARPQSAPQISVAYS